MEKCKEVQSNGESGVQFHEDVPSALSSTPKRQWWRFRPTVEPLVLMLMFTSPLTGSVSVFLLLERVCHSSNTARDCSAEQRAYSSQLTMYSTLLSAFVPALVALFVGSWGDKYGRRPIFIWCFFANTVTYLVYAVLASFPAVAAEWLLVPSLLATFSGGMFNIMCIANAFIADISPAEDKALRLGVLDSSQYLGTMLGSGLAAPLTTALHYNGIYILVAACMFLCFLYSIFLLRESKEPAERPEGGTCGCCGGIFRPEMALEALRTCLRERPNHGRPLVVIVVLVVFTGVVVTTGESVVSLQFYNQKFGWQAQDQQIFGFYNHGLTAIGTLIGVLVFVKWLDLPEAIIAVITFSCKMCAYVLFAISPISAYMYIGGAVASFGGMVWVLARTMVVKAVDKDEIGQVFAGAVTVEAFSPLVAAPLFNSIFASSIETFPGAFYLLSAGVMVLDLVAILIALYISRGSKKQQVDARC